MDNIGDSIAWPTRDPQWVSKVVIIGLIGLIPIVGQMVMYGWLLNALDNLRAGRNELPPAGFEHLARGVGLWVVLFVYGLAASVVIFILFIVASAMATAGAGQNSGAASAAGVLLFLLASAVTLIAVLLLYFLEIPIILATDRGGIAGGLNFAQVLAMARTDLGATLLAGLMVIVAGVIGSLGFVLCFVGVIFTEAYSIAILAGVARHYESALSRGTGPPAPAV